jgi:hypothetical protein
MTRCSHTVRLGIAIAGYLAWTGEGLHRDIGRGGGGGGVSPDAAVGWAEQAFAGKRWHAEIFPDDWCRQPLLPPRGAKTCHEGILKSRRGQPALHRGELLAMLKATPGNAVLKGPINGWQGITNVQIHSITCKANGAHGGRGHYLWKFASNMKGSSDQFPDLSQIVGAAMDSASSDPFCAESTLLRASLVGSNWTSTGWKENSPGFAFWFQAQNVEPRTVVGEQMIEYAGEGRAVRAHLWAIQPPAQPRGHWIMDEIYDKFGWHSGIVLEWDHARFLTIVELNWRSRSRSLFFEDMKSYIHHAPPGMDEPYTDKMSELGMLDIKAKTVDELVAYFQKYSEKGELEPKDQRFLRPTVPWNNYSDDVHLRRNRGADIARYIVNYISADGTYNMQSRNCQTFASDLYTFLTGHRVPLRSWPGEFSYYEHTEQFVQEPLSL